ncbi:oxidoreductase [Streptomyces olivochromogenes]|uniref:Oxidoreductase n=1 Tax=Streptomyces olivochromogenes TaxID=1963 RepID=A0A286PH33_STROL|nr:oxidoreductase [Streptomyces olivochromogenes]
MSNALVSDDLWERIAPPLPQPPGTPVGSGYRIEWRPQGGMLNIHDHNGQLVLNTADLLDEFRDLIHEGREASRVLDRDGTVLPDEPDDGTG